MDVLVMISIENLSTLTISEQDVYFSAKQNRGCGDSLVARPRRMQGLLAQTAVVILNAQEANPSFGGLFFFNSHF
jgi:hypothetical protein